MNIDKGFSEPDLDKILEIIQDVENEFVEDIRMQILEKNFITKKQIEVLKDIVEDFDERMEK